MTQKPPPPKDIARIRQLLAADTVPDEHASADLIWARKRLAHDPAPPPGEAVRPEVAYALVEELAQRREADPLAELAKLQHRTISKAARTALHRLRSQKVEVDVPAQDERSTGTGQPIQQGIQSLVTIYDGRWERLVWIGQDAPSGVLIYQCRVSALSGLIDFRAGSTTRREFRGRARSIRLELGGEMLETPTALWFVEDAARRSRTSGRSLPDAYAKASQTMGEVAQGDHPGLAVASSGCSASRMLELLELQELRFWSPDDTFLRQIQLKLDEVATSRLVINPGQRQQQIDTILERAMTQYYTPERCEACRQLLLDTAHLVGLKGTAAADLRAAADLFDQPPARVAAHPFARGFIERLMRPGAHESEGGASGSGSDANGEDDGGGSGLIVPG
jgi:hypothetical protein